ncbi:MAG TPA: YggS family pyridoxal phosphate-dependent enzyme [Rhodospirillales bacterium]|nr:YggS family pyridoxal phosphate-dependent enzyme [Rhodospirillales bacterium]
MNDDGGVDVRANLAGVKQAIAAAAKADGRAPDDVTLVAVSKTHGCPRIEAAIAAGQGTFGENRVQEAEGKWPALKEAWPDVRLHLIGPLQRNKVRRAVRLFDVIEVIDSLRLAAALAEVMEETGARPDVLIQVNTGEEKQKAGVLPFEADALIRACVEDLALPVRGLMCIPPVDEEPALHFALLREIARRNGLADLSMGMSEDYETAIRFGATMVRVGSAIFGHRPSAAG